MSDLSSQLSAFKNKIRSGPYVPTPRQAINKASDLNPVSNEVPVREARDVTTASSNKRPPDTVNEAIKRQRTALRNMPGSHLSTQLHLAVEHIKQNDKPIKVKDLQEYLSFDITQTLLPLLKEIDRLKYDHKSDTFEYVSLHNIRSSEDLLNFLRVQPTFKGIPVKELKDGWANYLQSINELEAENKILVLRTKKENAPRLVWANFGGNLNTIDEDFKYMWTRAKIPNPDDLYQDLVDQGLKPTGADPNIIKRKPKKEEKKQKKTRRGKITNTHMKGILRDYSQFM
ncbi:transcription factor TFIIE beta subunit, TFIIEB, Tfa2 [Yamadazyma tenuis]|uniref:Transcription initiation factor IIE subunit beta n=1 Tax=Candida tenuis (strain ATCC 10573 / BCRC 21748 / CBS 615 / JCM 9827 / NBRC 10315 / NRRL Y-1498 / VKM Y-70) TaxID=590646 RepID=G3BDL0_CANTC|nr:transcription initiation factor IIE, beta subunit [Yamadazyma tenuis ATCC 10573]EGV60325.1 transcription initiation factor IIE, beta subunit [Yamadazyma tenuis ATCC 10573]WEJ94435.1 transcription factor TFIIE beta subunit, TFIIEB, Tfa2 [Yamadazyma tenuis]